MQSSSPSSGRKAQLTQGLGSGLAAFLILWGLSFSPALGRLENLAGDVLRTRLAKPFVSPIEIVYLDDTSLKTAENQYGLPYPWPRESYATAIKFFKRAGTKAVVFDFLFTSHSPNGNADDLQLARAAKAHGQVFSGLQISAANQPDAVKRMEAQGGHYSLDLSATSSVLFEGQGVEAPYAPLWGGFTGIGDVDFQQDADSLNRRARLFSLVHGKVYPSLAFSAAWNLAGRPKISLNSDTLSFADKAFSVGKGAMLHILFRKPQPRSQSASLIDVITSENALAGGDKPSLDPARFKGKVVLVGSDAPGLLDLRPSPLNKRGPGVELQAMVLDNLLSGQSLDVVPMGPMLWAFLLILCMLIARVSFSFRGPAVFLPSLIAALAILSLSAWAYRAHNTLVPTATPLLGMITALALSAGENYRLAALQRNRVQNIFGQFLSPAVLKKLSADGSALKTGGETKDLAVFFSDLAGFTTFSEKLSPEQLVVILNTYLEEMGEVVVGRHDGYVDKYIGDAIMAIWGAPTPHANPALEAAQAAWHCQRRLAEIQPKLAKLGLDAGSEGLVMRIGINYGPCVVGLMGSTRKLNYTVMGDTVNTASRLEGANKPYGTRIMLSDSARQACGDAILVRTLDFLKVKGKSDATKVHELLGLKGEPGALYAQPYLDTYEEALSYYRAGRFESALSILEGCVKAAPQDSVAKLYAARCAEFIQHPPEGIWDGVYVMKTK